MLFLLPVLSAILLCATFPPLEIGWLAFVALIPFLIFIERSTNTRQLCIGSAALGMMYGCYSLFPLASTNAWWWIERTATLFEYKEAALYTFLAVLAAIGNAPFFILFALAYKKIRAQNSLSRWFRWWPLRVVALAAVWALLEYLRTLIPGGIAWQELGISLASEPYIRQIASVVGIYGLGALAVAVNVCLHESFFAKTVEKVQIHAAQLVGAVFLLVATVVFGYYRIEMLNSIGSNDAGDVARSAHRTVRVAVIHSHLTTQEESIGLAGFTYYEAAAKAALEEKPAVIVFPENTLSFLVIDEALNLPIGYQLPGSTIKKVYDTLLGWSAASPNTAFLIGLHSKKDAQLFNSIVHIEAGSIRSIYHKHHPLPLSEKDFSADHDRSPFFFETAAGRIFPLICSEILYSDVIARAREVDIIAVSGNDAIFGSSIVARRGRQTAIMKAIESGKHIIVSTKGLESAIIDSSGRITSVPVGQAFLVADIRL